MRRCNAADDIYVLVLQASRDIIITKARIFMQKLLLNMHIFIHSKIQKYAKKMYCMLKKPNIKKII
jgi:hypothetical protein